MDTKTLIINLNKIFCDFNKKNKRYSEVWLSDVDFGGLYYSGQYVLNVKAEHEIESSTEEIRDIIFMLDELAKEELGYIFRVAVYNSNEKIHCQSEEALVYNETNTC